MFTDFFQNTITDVGAIGPDRARGGLYLLLPPGYTGEIPKGYFAFESKTYNVFLFFRTIMKAGENGPDPAPLSRSPSRPASIRCGRWRKTSSPWSFRMAAASAST